MAKTTQNVQDAFDLVTSIYKEVEAANFPKTAEVGKDISAGTDKVNDEEKKATPESQSGAASAAENAKDQPGKMPVAKGESAKNTGATAVKNTELTPIATAEKPAVAKKEVAAMSDSETKTAMAQKQAQAERLMDNIVGILKSAEAPVEAAVDPLQKEAMDKGAEYAYFYYLGRKTRQEHAMELKEANIRADLLDKVGGIDGLLDKAAEADPGSVLPPELAGAAGAMPMEGAMPAEAGMEAPAEGGGDDEAALEQIAQVLSESGVSAEELEQMIQQISALKAQGMDDEQIMQALSELADEAGGGAGAPGEGAPETPAMEAAEDPAVEAAETPAQEASEHPEKTASIQKTAEQVRAGIDIAKAFLRNGGK